MGLGYSDVRRADPRFEAATWSALGGARSVLNIGAGSYEPPDREVIAVEPSPVMIAQRPPDAAPAIQGVVEALPLEDKSVDATMGVFTMQHWNDVERGLAEVPGPDATESCAPWTRSTSACGWRVRGRRWIFRRSDLFVQWS